MVKEIVGNRQCYRDAFQFIGGDFGHYRKVVFVLSENGDVESDEGPILEKLSRFSDFESRSLLIRNVTDPSGKIINVLFVPKDCPKLRGERFTPTDELPPANETYVVETWNEENDPRARKTTLVLVDDLEQAARIAKRRITTNLGYSKEYITAQATLVSPEEWIEIGRELIMNGEDLPGFILRWGGLKKFAEDFRSNNE